MCFSVASRTQGNQVFLRIFSRLTAEPLMDDGLRVLSWNRSLVISKRRGVTLHFEAPGNGSLLIATVARFVEIDSRCFPTMFNERSTLLLRKETEEPRQRIQQYVWFPTIEICHSQEIRANHLEALAPGFIGSQHQTGRLNRLLNLRNLALVRLEIDDLERFAIFSG
jgi:hypothetical protein